VQGADAVFDQGLALHEQGRLAEAERLYLEALRLQPKHVDAWHLLGVIALQNGQCQTAVDLIGKAVLLDVTLASAHNNRAVALHKLGRLHEALAGFNKAIALQPDYAEAHNNRGNALREAGRLDEALAACDTAIALNPNYAVAHNNRGIILRQTGRLEAALASYDTAIALLPDNAEAHGNRGNALLELKRPDEALASYDTAIALQPNYAEAHKGRGNALVDLERLEDALSSYDQAIALQPDYAEAYSDRGRLLRTLQRPLEALASFNRAIALKPEDPATYLSRGELLRFEGRTDEAVASLEAGLAVDKLHGGCRLGTCLAQLPIIYGSEAEVPLRRQRYIASLERLAAAVAEPVVMRSVAGVLGIPPFYLPYQGENDVAPQALYGQMACRILAETLPPAVLAPRPSPGERIRLGIVSGYFNSHTVFKLFLEGWLTELDRDRFEVTGFYTGATSDDLTALAADLCDRFVRNLPSAMAWREAISATAPNVLLYPEIGMDPMVGWLAPQRLAPVQCVSWGHPETTGMPTVDYFLSSDLMEPPDGETHYTERMVRLPRLGLHYASHDVRPIPMDRAALGAEPSVPVFWSGQSLFKYAPRYDWIFPHIAAAVGACRFVFVTTVTPALTAVFRERLGRAFAACGLDAEDYCVILPAMPHNNYIGVAEAADVMLDPPGWSGGKSTLDCLLVNPAIVTLPGRFMRGRHTAAILRQIGCEETVATSPEEYVAIAARLALDAAWRTRVRQAVAEGKPRAFRDTGYVRALERFLTDAVAFA
jgi:predicted O-linked N-acetylglucosamine transferase (SPINDLY family)